MRISDWSSDVCSSDLVPKTEGEGKVQKTTMVALTSEQLAKVESLVKEAVGFDAARGDSVSVQNAAFVQPESIPPVSALPIWQQPQVLSIARQAGGVMLLLALTLARQRVGEGKRGSVLW